MRLADEKKKTQATKIAEEKKKVEEIKQAAEKKAIEAKKIAEEQKRTEAIRLAEEKRRAEEIRIAEGGKKTEMMKLAEGKRKAEEIKLSEERKKAEAVKRAEEKWKAEVVKQAEEKRLAEEIKIAEEKKRMEAMKLADAKKKEEQIKFHEGKKRTEAIEDKQEVQKIEHVKADEKEMITKLQLDKMRDMTVQVSVKEEVRVAEVVKLTYESNIVENKAHKSVQHHKSDVKEKAVENEKTESEKKRRSEALKLTEVKRNAEAIKQAEQRSKTEALKAAAEKRLNEEKRKVEEMKAADLKKKHDYLAQIEKKRKLQAEKNKIYEAICLANEKKTGTKTSLSATIWSTYDSSKSPTEQSSNISKEPELPTLKTIAAKISGASSLPQKTFQQSSNQPPSLKSSSEPLKDNRSNNLSSPTNPGAFEMGIGTFYDWTTPSALARKTELHMELPIHRQCQQKLDDMKRDLNIKCANKLYQMCAPCSTNLSKPPGPCPVCPDGPPLPPSRALPPPSGDIPLRPSSSVSHDSESIRASPAQLSGLSKYFNSTTISGRANVAKTTFAVLGLGYALNRMMEIPKETKPKH